MVLARVSPSPYGRWGNEGSLHLGLGRALKGSALLFAARFTVSLLLLTPCRWLWLPLFSFASLSAGPHPNFPQTAAIELHFTQCPAPTGIGGVSPELPVVIIVGPKPRVRGKAKLLATFPLRSPFLLYLRGPMLGEEASVEGNSYRQTLWPPVSSSRLGPRQVPRGPGSVIGGWPQPSLLPVPLRPWPLAAAASPPPASCPAPSSVSPAGTLSSKPPRVPGLIWPGARVQAAAGPSGAGSRGRAQAWDPRGRRKLYSICGAGTCWAAGEWGSRATQPGFGSGRPADAVSGSCTPLILRWWVGDGGGIWTGSLGKWEVMWPRMKSLGGWVGWEVRAGNR